MRSYLGVRGSAAYAVATSIPCKTAPTGTTARRRQGSHQLAAAVGSRGTQWTVVVVGSNSLFLLSSYSFRRCVFIVLNVLVGAVGLILGTQLYLVRLVSFCWDDKWKMQIIRRAKKKADGKCFSVTEPSRRSNISFCMNG